MTATVPAATVYEDPLLPHQVRIKGDLGTDTLTVTCSCLIRPDGSYTPPIEPRQHLTPSELRAAFRAHEKEVTRS